MSFFGRTVSPILTLVVAVLSLSIGKFNTVTSHGCSFERDFGPPLWSQLLLFLSISVLFIFPGLL